MKKKLMATLLTLAVTATVLVGCGSTTNEASGTAKGSEASSETASSSESAGTDAGVATADNTGSLEETFNAEGLNQAKVIHLGYQGSAAFAWLEQRNHWFEEEFAADGITVEFEQFLSGPPMIESMAAGRLDISNIGDMPPINARGQGIDVKVIGKCGNTPFSNSLCVPIGSDIKDLADLKGKKIATQVGSSGHHFISLLLNSAELTLDDIELVNLSAPDGVAALEAKQIDALSTWEPYGTQVVNRGAGTIYIDSTGIKQNTSTYIVRNDFAKENPELTARFLKVWMKYVDFIESDRENALQIISEESGYAIEDIKRSVLEGDYSIAFTDYDYEQELSTKEFLIETGTLENDYDINELYDFSYLERAEELYEAENNS